jgi:hypothetical protein
MKYRIAIIKQSDKTDSFIPQWKFWFLPWQNFYTTDIKRKTTKPVICKTKEMCLEYFLCKKETHKEKDKRNYPIFHFYYMPEHRSYLSYAPVV